MMTSFIQFEPIVTTGNLLTIASFALFGIGSFFSMRERSKTNTFLISELKDRMDRADIEQIKERVSIMWLFQLRRGLVEAEINGLGKSKSPFELTEKAKELIMPVVPELRRFYESIGGHDLGLVELATAIEAHYGHKISDLVCKKVPVSEAACMVVAISQLREISDETIDRATEAAIRDKSRMIKLRDLPIAKDAKAGKAWFTK